MQWNLREKDCPQIDVKQDHITGLSMWLEKIAELALEYDREWNTLVVDIWPESEGEIILMGHLQIKRRYENGASYADDAGFRVLANLENGGIKGLGEDEDSSWDDVPLIKKWLNSAVASERTNIKLRELSQNNAFEIRLTMGEGALKDRINTILKAEQREKIIAYKNLFDLIFGVLNSEQRKNRWDNCRIHLEDYLLEGITEEIFFLSLMKTDFDQEEILMHIHYMDFLSEDRDELVEAVNHIGKIYRLPYEYTRGIGSSANINIDAERLADWFQPLGYKLLRWNREERSHPSLNETHDKDFCGFIIEERYAQDLISLARQAKVELFIQELSEHGIEYDYQRPALFQDTTYLDRHDAESLILAHKNFFYLVASSSSLEQKKKDLIWSNIEKTLEWDFFEFQGGAYSASSFEAALGEATAPDYDDPSVMRNNMFYIETPWEWLVNEVENVYEFFDFNEKLDKEIKFYSNDNIQELSSWLGKEGYQLIRWHITQFYKPEEEQSFCAFIVKKEDSTQVLSLAHKARIWVDLVS